MSSSYYNTAYIHMHIDMQVMYGNVPERLHSYRI